MSSALIQRTLTAEPTQARIDPNGIALAEIHRVIDILSDVVEDIGGLNAAVVPALQNLARDVHEFGQNLRPIVDGLYLLHGSYPKYLPSATSILPRAIGNVFASLDRVKITCANDALPQALYGTGPYLLSLRKPLGLDSPRIRLWCHLRRLPAMVESMQFVLGTIAMLVDEIDGPAFKARAGHFIFNFGGGVSDSCIRVRRRAEALSRVLQRRVPVQ
ncbi:hypothetical protein C8R46DRAFT_475254 [Mycena filopes]|nr:hypothetical protein C8R46DRAFT_475254 [Mycena filopes]